MSSRLSNLTSALETPLLVAGVLGFIVYGLLLPRVHPDAGTSSPMPALEVREIADSYLESIGVEGPYANVSISFERNSELLKWAQQGEDLPDVVRRLRENAYNPLPVYYHRVLYRRPDNESDRMQDVAEVRLLNDGRVVEVTTPGVTDRTHDVEVSQSPGSNLNGADVDFKSFARTYLDRSAWSEVPFVVDSLAVIRDGEASGAVVTFRAAELVSGTTPIVRVEVGNRGDLRELVLKNFRSEEEGVGSDVDLQIGGSSAEGPWDVVKFITHSILFLLLLVLFYRRLDARFIDLRGAFRDAVFAGFLGLIASGVAVIYLIGVDTGLHGWFFVLSVVISVVAALSTLAVVFVAAAVGDSYVREAWPESVRPLDLVRQLSVINEPVGRSLVHGVAAAGVLTAVGVLALHLPGAGINLGSEFPRATSLRPILGDVANFGWLGMYLMFAVSAAVGGWLRRGNPRAAVVVPVIIFALVDVAAMPIDSVWHLPLVNMVSGAILMWCFIRHGIVAAVVAFVVAGLSVSLAPGWLASPVPSTLDFISGILVVLLLVAVGVVGAASSRRIEKRVVYVPPYVREHSEQQRIERELEIARTVQMSFLPRVMPQMDGLDAHGVCFPAHEVGGDYFDVIVIDERRVAVVIGDVSGKGIQAAFYMTLVKGIILTLAEKGAPPKAVLSRVNGVFCESAQKGTFISLIYGVLDVGTGHFQFARAGHNPLVIVRDGKPEFRQPNGMAIGLVDDERFAASLEQDQLQLDRGDYLVLYTDGVTEVMDAQREQFGESRLANAMEEGGAYTAADLLDRIQAAIDDFAAPEGRLDDMTLIVLRRPPASEINVKIDTESLLSKTDATHEHR